MKMLGKFRNYRQFFIAPANEQGAIKQFNFLSVSPFVGTSVNNSCRVEHERVHFCSIK